MRGLLRRTTLARAPTRARTRAAAALLRAGVLPLSWFDNALVERGVDGAFRVLGTSDTPLLPPLIALVLLVGTAALAWWRE